MQETHTIKDYRRTIAASKGSKERVIIREQSGEGACNRERIGACKCKRLTWDYAFKMSGLFLNGQARSEDGFLAGGIRGMQIQRRVIFA